MFKVGIVGGTGYTGVELLRILANHPSVSLHVITSRSEQGVKVADMFPNLRGAVDLEFEAPSLAALSDCDVVFFATPNGVAMGQVPELLDAGVKVIDLSADFRIKDADVWAQWYGQAHTCPELLADAVYGLPEVNRERVISAKLVANPGCYPTAVQLGFLPLVSKGLVDAGALIADAKSGVSGAGRGATIGMLLGECSESFKAYGVAGHRHLPEISQGLQQVSNAPVGLTFVPHLTPMIRGIHATLYATLTEQALADLSLNNGEIGLQSMYEGFYEHEPFVDVMPTGAHPETRSVKGANHCRIAVHRPQGGNVVVVLSVIDNLVKGAAGQAVQNMNLMLGLEESEGLRAVALMP